MDRYFSGLNWGYVVIWSVLISQWNCHYVNVSRVVYWVSDFDWGCGAANMSRISTSSAGSTCCLHMDFLLFLCSFSWWHRMRSVLPIYSTSQCAHFTPLFVTYIFVYLHNVDVLVEDKIAGDLLPGNLISR